MEQCAIGRVTVDGGLEGDHKGPKFPKRRITILAIEDWHRTLDDLAAGSAPPGLPWTLRRANLLVEGVRLPRARGGIIGIGPARFEVCYPTQPCARMNEAYPGLLKAMNEAYPGLLKALQPDWRGGVSCAVQCGGTLRLGDTVEVLVSPAERPRRRLPG